MSRFAREAVVTNPSATGAWHERVVAASWVVNSTVRSTSASEIFPKIPQATTRSAGVDPGIVVDQRGIAYDDLHLVQFVPCRQFACLGRIARIEFDQACGDIAPTRMLGENTDQIVSPARTQADHPQRTADATSRAIRIWFCTASSRWAGWYRAGRSPRAGHANRVRSPRPSVARNYRAGQLFSA